MMCWSSVLPLTGLTSHVKGRFYFLSWIWILFSFCKPGWTFQKCIILGTGWASESECVGVVVLRSLMAEGMEREREREDQMNDSNRVSWIFKTIQGKPRAEWWLVSTVFRAKSEIYNMKKTWNILLQMWSLCFRCHVFLSDFYLDVSCTCSGVCVGFKSLNINQILPGKH